MTNKLIEELAIESGIALGNNFAEGSRRDLLTKFAELIINECAEVAGCNAHVSGFELGDLIKEHFK
jgi:hypothetical protein